MPAPVNVSNVAFPLRNLTYQEPTRDHVLILYMSGWGVYLSTVVFVFVTVCPPLRGTRLPYVSRLHIVPLHLIRSSTLIAAALPMEGE